MSNNTRLGLKLLQEISASLPFTATVTSYPAFFNLILSNSLISLSSSAIKIFFILNIPLANHNSLLHNLCLHLLYHLHFKLVMNLVETGSARFKPMAGFIGEINQAQHYRHFGKDTYYS